eukprot:COSAG06_NODE_3741_length_4955_cov_47.397309_1_plen_41_part_10
MYGAASEFSVLYCAAYLADEGGQGMEPAEGASVCKAVRVPV